MIIRPDVGAVQLVSKGLIKKWIRSLFCMFSFIYVFLKTSKCFLLNVVYEGKNEWSNFSVSFPEAEISILSFRVKIDENKNFYFSLDFKLWMNLCLIHKTKNAQVCRLKLQLSCNQVFARYNPSWEIFLLSYN